MFIWSFIIYIHIKLLSWQGTITVLCSSEQYKYNLFSHGAYIIAGEKNFKQVVVCMLRRVNHDQLFETVDLACQAPLSLGILQARILKWVVMPSSRGSSQPRDRTRISYVSCMGRRALYHPVPPGKAKTSSQLSHYLIIVVDSTTEKNREPKKTLKQEDSEWSGRLLRTQHFHWALKNTSLFTGWRKMRQGSVGAESCQNGRNGVSQSPETERNMEQWKALRRRVAH